MTKGEKSDLAASKELLAIYERIALHLGVNPALERSKGFAAECFRTNALKVLLERVSRCKCVECCGGTNA